MAVLRRLLGRLAAALLALALAALTLLLALHGRKTRQAHRLHPAVGSDGLDALHGRQMALAAWRSALAACSAAARSAAASACAFMRAW